MKKPLKTFLEKSEEKAFSAEHRKRINFNMGKYHVKVKEGKKQFEDLEKARKVANNIKAYTMQNLPYLLEEFEKHFTSRGGKVIWAESSEDALMEIDKIINAKKAKLIVKSKSMITEEIKLNPFLKNQGVEVLETDLGEFIVQVKGEPPYHIVTPAMHLSKEDIAELFHKEFGTSSDATAANSSNALPKG